MAFTMNSNLRKQIEELNLTATEQANSELGEETAEKQAAYQAASEALNSKAMEVADANPGNFMAVFASPEVQALQKAGEAAKKAMDSASVKPGDVLAMVTAEILTVAFPAMLTESQRNDYKGSTIRLQVDKDGVVKIGGASKSGASGTNSVSVSVGTAVEEYANMTAAVSEVFDANEVLRQCYDYQRKNVADGTQSRKDGETGYIQKISPSSKTVKFFGRLCAYTGEEVEIQRGDSVLATYRIDGDAVKANIDGKEVSWKRTDLVLQQIV